MLFLPCVAFATHFQQKSLLRGIPLTMERCLCLPHPQIWKQKWYCQQRPIAILNVVSKVIDKIAAQLLSLALLDKLVLEQHGFLKGRSTLTNLIIYCDFITTLTKTHRQIDSLYFGFSMAFDLVDHHIYWQESFGTSVFGDLSSSSFSPTLSAGDARFRYAVAARNSLQLPLNLPKALVWIPLHLLYV